MPTIDWAIWSAIAQGVGAIGSMAVAIVVYVYSRRSLQLQSATQYAGNWRELTKLLLESERANAAHARLQTATDRDHEDECLVIQMFLDQALLAYRANASGGIPAVELAKEFHAIWRSVGNNRYQLVAEILDGQSFPTNFVKRFKLAGEQYKPKEKVNG